MSQKKDTPELRRPRNPLAFAPLMRKGGAHQRGRGGERQLAKRETEQMIRKGRRDKDR